MTEQKFHHGDLVRIARRDFTVFIRGLGRVSWYEEWQLAMIAPASNDVLDEWTAESAAETDLKGSLDWIFSHGAEVLQEAHGASLQALANCMGLSSLWGSDGEGITYYYNAMAVLAVAKPFLETGDLAGWLARCK